MSKAEKIDKLVQIEWADFQIVKNEGGRASCQDDPETFFIMRKSYFEPLSEDVIDCILKDFNDAHSQGRNLVSEKYAWMMQSTSPEQFIQICDSLPQPSVVAKTYIELIVAYELDWMQELLMKFPKLSKHGRPVKTIDDTTQQTSFETYLRGELTTYSENTVKLYYDCVKNFKDKGVNLIFKTLEHEVRAYGFANISDAELKLK